MAVELGCPAQVGDLLDLDEDMVLTLVEAHEERWSRQEHLLASLIEVTDGVHLRHLSALGAKKVPKAIEVTRPGTRRKRRRATVAEMVGLMGLEVNDGR